MFGNCGNMPDLFKNQKCAVVSESVPCLFQQDPIIVIRCEVQW